MQMLLAQRVQLRGGSALAILHSFVIPLLKASFSKYKLVPVIWIFVIRTYNTIPTLSDELNLQCDPKVNRLF